MSIAGSQYSSVLPPFEVRRWNSVGDIVCSASPSAGCILSLHIMIHAGTQQDRKPFVLIRVALSHYSMVIHAITYRVDTAGL